MDIAYARLKAGYSAIVANRGKEVEPHGEQIAHLVTGVNQGNRAIKC